MTEVTMSLPDDLARQAQRAGLLSSERLEQWLRGQLNNERVEELFAAIDRMAAIQPAAVMSPEDVAEEIAAMRAERRARTAR